MPNSYSLDEIKGLTESLSDLNRLRILNLLDHYGQSMVQSDIATSLDLNQSLLSRHFAYLKTRKVIVYNRHAMFVYFDINPVYSDTIKSFLKSIEVVQLSKDRLRFRNIKSTLKLDGPKNKLKYNPPDE